MTPPRDRHPIYPRRRLYIGFAVLAALVVVLFAARGALQRTMAGWTGEEALGEQIKGTLALVYLRATEGTPDTEPLYPMANRRRVPLRHQHFSGAGGRSRKVERSIRLISEAGFHWIRQEFPGKISRSAPRAITGTTVGTRAPGKSMT